MPIVAVSMTDSDLEELESLLIEGEFSNRSDVVRHAVQALISKHRNIESAKGTITAVLTAIYYAKGHIHSIRAVQHEFKKYLTATIHSHTNDGRCIDVMIVIAKAEIVRDFLKKIRAQKKVLKVEANLIGGDH